jgi:hypothetical protein
MATKLGNVLILKVMRDLEGDDVHTGVRYRDVTEDFKGSRYERPVLEGRFIEVEVMRNFRVTESKKMHVEELDTPWVKS